MNELFILKELVWIWLILLRLTKLELQKCGYIVTEILIEVCLQKFYFKIYKSIR